MKAFAIALALVSAPALSSPELDKCIKDLQEFSAIAETMLIKVTNRQYYGEPTKTIDITGRDVIHEQTARFPTPVWALYSATVVMPQGNKCMAIADRTGE